MKNNAKLRIASSVLVIVLIVASGWFEQFAKGNTHEISIDGFSIWIAAPLFLMLFAVMAAHTVRAQIMVLIVLTILAGFGLVGYWDAMFLHPDAQGALIFLFIPLYQIIGPTLTLVGVIFARMRAFRITRDSHD